MAGVCVCVFVLNAGSGTTGTSVYSIAKDSRAVSRLVFSKYCKGSTAKAREQIGAHNNWACSATIAFKLPKLFV